MLRTATLQYQLLTQSGSCQDVIGAKVFSSSQAALRGQLLALIFPHQLASLPFGSVPTPKSSRTVKFIRRNDIDVPERFLRYCSIRSKRDLDSMLTRRAVLNLCIDRLRGTTSLCAIYLLSQLIDHVTCPSRKYLLAPPERLKGKARPNLNPVDKSTPSSCTCITKCRISIDSRAWRPSPTSTTSTPQSPLIEQ